MTEYKIIWIIFKIYKLTSVDASSCRNPGFVLKHSLRNALHIVFLTTKLPPGNCSNHFRTNLFIRFYFLKMPVMVVRLSKSENELWISLRKNHYLKIGSNYSGEM